MLHTKKRHPAGRLRSGSVDVGPEDWPNQEHISETMPVANANAASSDLISELRDMQVFIPPNLYDDQHNGAVEGCAHDAVQITSATGDDLSPLDGSAAAAGSPSKAIRVLRVRLPTAAELPSFHPALSQHFPVVAMATIRMSFYPVLLLRQKIKARAKLLLQSSSDASPKLTPTLIATIPLFRNWPTDAIGQVIKEATYQVFDGREYIAYEREPPRAVYFVVAGTCKLITRLPRGQSGGGVVNKGYSAANTHPHSLLVSPGSFGGINLLTNELYPSALRTTGKVELFVLTRSSFARILQSLPHQVRAHTISTAFEKRNERMSAHFPMTTDALRLNKLFSGISEEFALLLIDKLEPSAVPAEFVMQVGGAACEGMQFVRSGSVALYKRGTDTVIATLPAPVLIGDAALMYNSANEFTVKSCQDCDVYLLSRASFKVLCQQHPNEVDAMLDAARDQRKAELKHNHIKFRNVITEMPLFNKLIQPTHEREFLNLLTPKSYRPMSCICSTSSFCDRILVLTKGNVRVGEHHVMKKWESIGWACCVPHHWAMPVMALEKTVEVLEVPYLDLMLFLFQHGLLDQVTKMVKILMFPRAHRKEQWLEVMQRVGSHLPLYPVSQAIHVNLYEFGFCSVHMSALDLAEKEEKAKEAARKAMIPKPFKQVLRGVWVPMSK